MGNHESKAKESETDSKISSTEKSDLSVKVELMQKDAELRGLRFEIESLRMYRKLYLDYKKSSTEKSDLSVLAENEKLKSENKKLKAENEKYQELTVSSTLNDNDL